MKYDIFISFKNLDANGKKSRDCEIAEELYHFLQNKGLSVFFSNDSLERLGSSAYLKAIDDALDSAKIMVVVGTSKTNIESQWVESEWSGFINDIRSGIKKNAHIYSVIEGMAAAELQRSLRQYQSFGYSKENFEKLYNFITNALSRSTSSQPISLADNPKILPSRGNVISVTSSLVNSVKPNIIIGTIGSKNSGRTTLIAAIVTILEELGVSKPQRDNTNNIGIQYQTNKRSYSHIMHATNEDFMKNIVANSYKLDGALIVIDVTERITSEVREQIIMAHEIDVHRFVVFLNKIDTLEDTGLIDCAEMEIRELLKCYGCDGDNTPVIRGSALGALNGIPKWEAKIIELMNVVDEYIPNPIRDKDKPFLMPIEDVFVIKDRGIVLTGKIETGIVCVGDTPEIVGFSNETKTVTCLAVEMFRKIVDSGEAGDQVGLLVKGITKADVKRGMVIAKKGYIKPYKYFEAEIYVLTKDQGGITTPFHNNFCPQFYFRTFDILGKITLPRGVNCVKPGDNASITVELAYPAAINIGLRFAIRDNNKTVGSGKITRVF